jgi:hypothetical protein
LRCAAKLAYLMNFDAICPPYHHPAGSVSSGVRGRILDGRTSPQIKPDEKPFPWTDG